MRVCPECGLKVEGGMVCPVDRTPLADPGPDPLLGAQVGSFRVARRLGEGGMGTVYLGVHPGIGSRVAIKVLSHECTRQRDLVQRFFAEAKAVNVIRHEAIVNVIDLAQLEDGRPYIVMEYLDGTVLSSIFERTGPMPLGTLGGLVLEVLRAIGAAHGAGIVHRDLKPDNIFVTTGGRARVLDFGIAKLREDLMERTSATRTGSVLGTPHYMAPEQAMGRKIDARADLYALGVILYEGATGQKPIPGDSIYVLIRNHVEHVPVAPRTLRGDLPVAYGEVIMRALAKDPSQRFASALEFGAALEAAMRGLEHAGWSAVPAGSAIDPNARSSLRSGAEQGPSTRASVSVPLVTPETPLVAQFGAPRPTKKSGAGSVALASAFVVLAVAGVLGAGWWWFGDRAAEVIAAGDHTVDSAGSPTAASAPNEPAATSPASPGAAEPGPTDVAVEPGPTNSDAVGVDGAAGPGAEQPSASSDASRGSGSRALVGEGASAEGQGAVRQDADRSPGTASPNVSQADARSMSERRAAAGSTQARPTSTKADAESPREGVAADDLVTAESAPSKFAAFDVSGFLPKAEKLAQKHYRDAELIKIIAEGVHPNGRADLTLEGRPLAVTYRFRSLTAARQPSNAPLGAQSTVECAIVVNVTENGVKSYTTNSPLDDCGVPIRMPRCSAQRVWKKATASGAPTGNVVGVLIYMLKTSKGPPEWRFEVESAFGPTWLPDDC